MVCVYQWTGVVCLDVYLFDDQEAGQVERIAVAGPSEVRKYDSETLLMFQPVIITLRTRVRMNMSMIYPD
jgi:hypothetical protein